MDRMIKMLEVRIDAQKLINGTNTFDMDVNSIKFMTTQEREDFDEAMGIALTCVNNAIVRRVSESQMHEVDLDE